jgi:peptidoglycan DL-endopeptidase CwlO
MRSTPGVRARTFRLLRLVLVPLAVLAAGSQPALAARKAAPGAVPAPAVVVTVPLSDAATPPRLTRAEAVRIALATAEAQIGKPYRWAATGPASFDCSGLTRFAWAAAGVEIPRVSRWQYRDLEHVAKSDLRPGDLVFFGTKRIHHVGIYLGGGKMINAPHAGAKVRIEKLWRDYAGAARPLA